MTVDEPGGWRLRCRDCGVTTGALNWVTLLAKRGGPFCPSCGSNEVTAQDSVTGSAVAFPRPLVPPVQWWQCCNCGGTGLDWSGESCPHCQGLGHCP